MITLDQLEELRTTLETRILPALGGSAPPDLPRDAQAFHDRLRDSLTARTLRDPIPYQPAQLFKELYCVWQAHLPALPHITSDSLPVSFEHALFTMARDPDLFKSGFAAPGRGTYSADFDRAILPPPPLPPAPPAPPSLHSLLFSANPTPQAVLETRKSADLDDQIQLFYDLRHKDDKRTLIGTIATDSTKRSLIATGPSVLHEAYMHLALGTTATPAPTPALHAAVSLELPPDRIAEEDKEYKVSMAFLEKYSAKIEEKLKEAEKAQEAADKVAKDAKEKADKDKDAFDKAEERLATATTNKTKAGATLTGAIANVTAADAAKQAADAGTDPDRQQTAAAAKQAADAAKQAADAAKQDADLEFISAAAAKTLAETAKQTAEAEAKQRAEEAEKAAEKAKFWRDELSDIKTMRENLGKEQEWYTERFSHRPEATIITIPLEGGRALKLAMEEGAAKRFLKGGKAEMEAVKTTLTELKSELEARLAPGVPLTPAKREELERAYEEVSGALSKMNKQRFVEVKSDKGAELRLSTGSHTLKDSSDGYKSFALQRFSYRRDYDSAKAGLMSLPAEIKACIRFDDENKKFYVSNSLEPGEYQQVFNVLKKDFKLESAQMYPEGTQGFEPTLEDNQVRAGMLCIVNSRQAKGMPQSLSPEAGSSVVMIEQGAQKEYLTMEEYKEFIHAATSTPPAGALVAPTIKFIHSFTPSIAERRAQGFRFGSAKVQGAPTPTPTAGHVPAKPPTITSPKPPPGVSLKL